MTRASVAAPWLNLPGHLTLDEAMSFSVYRRGLGHCTGRFG